MAAPFNPYRVLGIAREANDTQIRTAYRTLARRYHPDINPDAVEQFHQLSQAYAILSSAKKRALFDEFGEASLHRHFDPYAARAARARADTARRPPQAASNPRTTDADRGSPRDPRTTAGGGIRNPADPRQSTTARSRQATTPPGRSAPPADNRGTTPRARSTTAGRHPPNPGEVGPRDLLLPLSISLGQALRGDKLRVTPPGGGPTLTVAVPPNVESGTRLRLAGRGKAGDSRHKPGDLLIAITVADNPFFWRQGDHLVLELPLSVGEALDGTRLEIPTLDGPVRITIPRGSRGGERLRLAGRGPILTGDRRGDLLVLLSLRLPPGAEGQRRLLERLEGLYGADLRRGLQL